MNGVTLLLVIVVISLTSLLIVIGYQVFLVVRGVKKILDKIDNILDHPEGKIASIIEGFRKKTSN